MKKIVIDLDGTITLGDTSDYENVSPNTVVIKRMQDFRAMGFEIAINTARNMRTFEAWSVRVNYEFPLRYFPFFLHRSLIQRTLTGPCDMASTV